MLLVKLHKMERYGTDYLCKNMPINVKKEYKTHLISKVEKAIKRTRWKALQFLEKLNSINNTKTYGFQSTIFNK